MDLSIEISPEILEDLIGICTGLYSPVNGFMKEADYKSVVREMVLTSGEVWPLPVTLDISAELFTQLSCGDELFIERNAEKIAKLKVQDLFQVDAEKDATFIFGTTDLSHPGVKKEIERSPFRVGGKVELLDKSLLDGVLDPQRTRKHFSDKGWETVLGFQTRNPIHRGHEYLQRLGLNRCDGLFINPSVGWKKQGDFTEKAVFAAYNKMIEKHYSSERVHMEGLRVYFRYAGPREAIFHALIRRNLGCTHFIIGRDHAGVGGFYEPYAAHELATGLQKKHDLGIDLIFSKEIYYCNKCECVVSHNDCEHTEDDFTSISGTAVRKFLSEGKYPDERFMRPEIADELLKLEEDLFIRR